MFATLACGMLGIQAGPLEAIDLAAGHGFAGVDLAIPACEDAAAVAAALDHAGLERGSAGGLVPGKITDCDEAAWRTSLAALPALADRARRLGFTRTTSVILPFHDELTPAAQVDCYRERLAAAAPILADHGIRLGLEYVSQATRRAGHPNHFVHDCAGSLELLAAIDQPNVGLLVDSFHWHCAGEDTALVRSLDREQVVVVHVNDAPAGRRLADQIAFERELPGASGVIDLAGFVAALRAIGYDGPVTAEPMDARLQELPVDERLARTRRALQTILA